MTEEIKKVIVARIDANGIFQGVEEINESDLTDAHVHLKFGCDLPPGKHRWVAEKRTFVQIEEGEELDKPAPHALRAIALGLVAMSDQGLELPPESLQWLDFYINTMDFAGDLCEETRAMLKRYLLMRGK